MPPPHAALLAHVPPHLVNMYSLARVFFGCMLAAGAAALGFRQMASIIARGAGCVVKCGHAEDKKCLWFLVEEFT
jgi:hypothetical protein